MPHSSILIRVDGSAGIGMGHVQRCLALAQACQSSGYRVFLVCHHASPVIRKAIDVAGVSLLEIDILKNDTYSAALDLARLAALHRTHWIVIDHPEYSIDYENFLLENCSSKLAIIDGQFRPHNCSLLINPNAFASAGNCRYTVPRNCEILAGYKYFLLDDIFLNRPRSLYLADGVDPIKRIVLTLGAADPRNLTLQICKQFSQANFGSHNVVIDVVVGPVNAHRNTIKHFLKARVDSRFVLHDSPANLVELLQECSICVSAAGITLGEAAFLAKPVIGVAILENQHSTVESLAELGILQSATLNTIANQCVELLDNPRIRERLAKNASSIIDGQGKNRIVNAMRRLSK